MKVSQQVLFNLLLTSRRAISTSSLSFYKSADVSEFNEQLCLRVEHVDMCTVSLNML